MAVKMLLDACLGREAELSRLVHGIVSGARVTTVVGPAGIGKSRLAEAAVARLLASEAWSGAVHRAELGALGSAEEVLATLSAAFPWRGRSRPADVEALASRCARRGPLLLLLHDAERQVAPTREMVATLSRHAPEVRFLVTSREPLALRGESVLVLGPLPPHDGVALFRARAATRADDPREAAALRELVVRLEGNPLAIELAAARSEILAPSALLARLDERLDLLALPGAPTERHTSLRASIALSWELLESRERGALCRLSTFAAPFDLEAAEGVLEGSGRALDALHLLVRKSLLAVEDDLFVMSESVRAFAAERFDGAAAARRQKALHYLRCARAWTQPSEPARRAILRSLPDWLDAVDAMIPADPRVACELAIVMESTLVGRIPLDLQRAIVDRALAAARRAGAARGAPSALLAQGLVAEARLRRLLGDNRGASDALEHARAAMPEGHPVAVEALRLSGLVERHRGRLGAARRLLEDALAAAAIAGLDAARGPLEDDLGVVCLDAGDLAAAEQHTLDALAHHRRAGDRRFEGISLGHLGLVAHLRGDLREASRRYEDALSIAREVGDPRFVDFTRAFLAMAALEAGEVERASVALADPLDMAREEPADPRAHAMLACAAAALAAAAGRSSDAAELLAEARTRLGPDCDGERGALAIVASSLVEGGAGASPPTPTCVEQQLALRLARSPARARAQHPDGTLARVLEIGPDRRWFSLDGAPRVGLARRRSLRLVLGLLSRMRESSPGVGVDWRELLGAGWPGEKVTPASGQRRAYVAVGTLRSLGLAEVLLHTDDGYLLDPAVELRHA